MQGRWGGGDRLGPVLSSPPFPEKVAASWGMCTCLDWSVGTAENTASSEAVSPSGMWACSPVGFVLGWPGGFSVVICVQTEHARGRAFYKCGAALLQNQLSAGPWVSRVPGLR